MKNFCSLVLLLGSVSMLSAQTPAQSSPSPASRSAMHQQHMQAVQLQLDEMRTRIDTLKSSLAKVKDPSTKQALQADLELWQAMTSHMEGMQKMMAGSNGAMSTHQHGAMPGCCAQMHDAAMKDGCCAAMKNGGSGCCGGNKCMQAPTNGPIAPDAGGPASD
jgi:hypothetical protein